MKKRKLFGSLLVAGVLAVGLGGSILPAGAQPRTFLVTLVTGQTLTVQLDLPPGAPVGEAQIPGVGKIASIQEIGGGAPPPQPAPDSSAEPAPGGGSAGPTPAGPGATATDGDPTGEAGASGDGEAVDADGDGKKDVDEDKKAGKGQAEVDVEGSDSTGKRGRDGRTPQLRRRALPNEEPTRQPGGAPTPSNPSFSLALPGPAPVGVPNFFIDKFRIPPFLLNIYQAAGIQYGVRWEVLAAINEIETDYGRNLNVSSAGALGWMQFMPATWKAYGVDGNGDGKKDPYNPVDAIFAAGRYLRAAGAEKDLRKAIFAYNHADWYVDSVLLRAKNIGGLPADLVGSLSGLTQGIFPVAAKARYADDLSERATERRVARGSNAAIPVESRADRRGIRIYADEGSPVTAVQDGKIINVGVSERLGRFVQLRDVYGNEYTYANLGEVSDKVAVPKERKESAEDVRKQLALPARDPKPDAPASAGNQAPRRASDSGRTKPRAPSAETDDVQLKLAKQRLFANPARREAYEAGGREQLLNTATPLPGKALLSKYFSLSYGLKRNDVMLEPLRKGQQVIAGTILGKIGASGNSDPNALFEIRPAGRGAPRIDPKPILDGWQLLQTSAVYRAEGRNPFFGPDAKNASVGQILLMGKGQLQRRVLNNSRIQLHSCGRDDVRTGRIDRRVLASLEFLAASGFKPTVTSLRCGRESTPTASGNVSHHSSGNAVDIARINGTPVLGNQGRGSITDLAVRRMLILQGTMKPAQIITLMKYQGTDNTLAMGDHADHIHVGFRPQYDPDSKEGRRMEAVLKPKQWIKLLDRLGDIDNPTVRRSASKYSIDVKKPKRASDAHVGE
ncbi:MAG TPA: lytic murein transglycosylase [Solirubrobacteraceae bacterium]|nr:lytic murein transglycosylase [Solirubrobacteraceae bacterium]